MISVIIPIYNRARYIRDCLESVFKQTYKDYEIILVDDGSTDNLREVLVPYMKGINYIYKENGGAASARNLGIKNAKGDYIAFLDSDDKWLDFKLDLEMQVLSRFPEAAFIFTDFSCFSDKKGKIADSYIRTYFFTLETYNLEFGKLFNSHCSLKDLDVRILYLPESINVYSGNVFKEVLLGPFFSTFTVLMRKHCIENVALFDESLNTGEDYEFFARVAKQFDVVYINYPTVAYRRFHEDQLSGPHMEVETNLVLLKVAKTLGFDDTEFYQKNKKYVDIRISHCYYGLGLAYFRRGIFLTAYINFLKSLKMNCKQRKIYLYVVVLLPIIIIGSLMNFLFRPRVKNG